MGNDNLIGGNELAKLLGVSSRNIRNLANDGELSCTVQGKNRKYDPAVAVREYIDYEKRKSAGKHTDKNAAEIELEKMKADLDWKRARADMAELELEELRGNMHSSLDVADMTADLIMTVKALLLALPGQLAVDLAETSNAGEASEILRRASNDMLVEISKYEYGPEKYLSRVRERHGLSDEDEAEI